MLIKKGTLNSRVVMATPKERKWLIDFLTFETDPKNGREPIVTRLFNAMSSSYPAGFDFKIKKQAKVDRVKVDFIDKRIPPAEFDETADLTWLRDYQLAGIETFRRRKRGIFWLATGAGKTEIAIGLVKAYPCAWLALVHRSQLADEIASRYEKRTGEKAGRVLEGRFSIPEGTRFVCATYQSLRAALKGGKRAKLAEQLITEAGGVIVDECHVAPAETFLKIIGMTRNAYYRAGLSGTPLARGDQKSIVAIGAIGTIIHRVRAGLLIDRGVLAKPTVRMVTVVQDQCSARTHDGVRKALIVRSTKRNDVLVHIAKKAQRPGFIFVHETDHGYLLEKALLKAGISAKFVWGNHSVASRKSLIKQMLSGRYEYIVCSSVFNEGIDVPELRSVIVGASGKSLIATFQRMGRGMRVDRAGDGSVREGGRAFEVWDILDIGNKWLSEHAQTRKAAYISEEFDTFVLKQPMLRGSL